MCAFTTRTRGVHRGVHIHTRTYWRAVIIKADSKRRNSDSGGGSMLECTELKIMQEWACIVHGG